MELTEKELETNQPVSLTVDMYDLLDLLQEEESVKKVSVSNEQIINIADANHSSTVLGHANENAEDVLGEEEEVPPLNIINNKIWITATIIDPLCDLSHQYVEFPDTPCGSYSIMSITLTAVNKLADFKCACGYIKEFSKCKKHLDFDARFEIVGNNSEITIEPVCGRIKNGEV